MLSKTRVLVLAATFCLALAAGPLLALGNCPAGEWAPEEGNCVLCLPGWEPRATGNTTGPPNNFACYACVKVGGGDGGGNGGGDGDGDGSGGMCVAPVERPFEIRPLQVGEVPEPPAAEAAAEA